MRRVFALVAATALSSGLIVSQPGPVAAQEPASPGRAIAASGSAATVARADDWRGQDLTGKDLRRTKAAGGDHRHADLRNAKLHYATLHHSQFHQSQLQRANLHHADLRHSVFHGADLSHATLHHARLHHAVLGTSDSRHATLYKVDLRSASLRHATLNHVDLRASAMHRVDLRNARMHHARLTGAVLHRARLHDIKARGADLRSVKAKRAAFTGANMPNAAFNSAQLPGTTFRKADLVGADFSARVTGRSSVSSTVPACGSTCSGAELTGADFTGANLTGANFAGADLSSAVLRDANLTNANFTGADLRNADLTGATWTGATFTGAITQGANFGSAKPPSTAAAIDFCTTQHVARSTPTYVGQGLVLDSYSAMRHSGTGTAVVVGPNGILFDASFVCDMPYPTYSGGVGSTRFVYPFTLTITGTRGSYTSALTGMTVDTRSFTGTVSRSNDGTISWDLASTATYTVNGITVTGAFSVTSSREWSVTVDGGSGSVTTPDGTFALNSFSGSFAYSNEQMAGEILIQASGTHAWFSALPATWTKNATLELDFGNSGSNLTVHPTLSLTATSAVGGNISTMTLTGQMPASGSTWATQGIRMTGSGQVYLKGQPVAVSGWYQGTGYQGQASATWDIDGFIDTPVPLGDGARLVSGALDFNSSTPGFTGEATVSLAAQSGRAFTASLVYENATNWSLTATGGGSSTWSPISGLTVPANAFAGTVTVANGKTTWALNIGSAGSPITWTSVAHGVSLQAWYSVSNTCPISDCNGATGIFLASNDGQLTFANPSFSAATGGALLADGSWATFTASGLGTKTFTGPNGGTVSLGGASLTLWQGDAPHSPVSGLTMPDVNNSGSGVGIEFCGSFAATQVPYIGTTQPAQGCVSWAPAGVVVGVTNLGVSMPGGSATADSNGDSVSGVNVSGGSIGGLAWTNLSSKPVVSIQQAALSLVPQTTTLTGSVTLPGDVMAALGKPMQPMSIPATATFSDPSWTTEDASFSLTAEVPLNYSSNGFSLQDFYIEASKTGPAFSFAVGVDATYRINGTDAPVSMSLAYANAALALKLTATGTGGGNDACNCDGVNGQFQTPEDYNYLSDAFMEIPGMHLWSITGQLIVSKGEPGFGIGATVYQDPRQMPLILHGSTWLQSKFYVNVDLLDPCLDFSFNSTDPNTYLQVKGGVLETTSFSISIAPATGCTVGSDIITGGINVGVTSSFGGQGSFDFELAFDPADKSFYEHVGIGDVTFGGITFTEGELTIDLTADKQTVTFDTEFGLPPSGDFTSDFDVTTSSTGMVFNGSVSMTDWDMAGGTFDVQSLTYQMSFDTSEGTFSSTANGKMKFSKKTNIAFTADIEYNNNALQQFDFDFQYTHGSSGWDYKLDYSSADHSLSGGLDIYYTQRTSHKFCSACHTYERHAYMTIWLDYWMDTNNPADATLNIGFSGSSSDGDLQVSGEAHLSTVDEGDDTAWAKLHVHINHVGSWDDSWTW